MTGPSAFIGNLTLQYISNSATRVAQFVNARLSSIMQTDGVQSTGYQNNEMSKVDPVIFGNKNVLSNA